MEQVRMIPTLGDGLIWIWKETLLRRVWSKYVDSRQGAEEYSYWLSPYSQSLLLVAPTTAVAGVQLTPRLPQGRLSCETYRNLSDTCVYLWQWINLTLVAVAALIKATTNGVQLTLPRLPRMTFVRNNINFPRCESIYDNKLIWSLCNQNTRADFCQTSEMISSWTMTFTSNIQRMSWLALFLQLQQLYRGSTNWGWLSSGQETGTDKGWMNIVRTPDLSSLVGATMKSISRMTFM